jgi:hypothetical protein
VAATFVGGASAGIRITARVPVSAAASATAWAWLPDEYAATPRARSVSVNRLTAL